MTGSGRAFCAGADMQALNSIASGNEEIPEHRPASSRASAANPNYQGRFSWMLGLKKPVICAINGPAVGMGFAITLYCDFRVAAQSARMGLIFPRRGLAIEFGSSWMLPRIVGLTNAMDLAMTGRLIDANEAQRLGLVSRVVPDGELMTAARALAEDLATQCTPLGLSHIKRLVYGHLFTDLATALREDDEATAEMLRSEDFREGIRAFQEKRAAKFTGR